MDTEKECRLDVEDILHRYPLHLVLRHISLYVEKEAKGLEDMESRAKFNRLAIDLYKLSEDAE